MAEVLITLGIIGVVAALTIPTLVAKHQKLVVVNRLKQTYSLLKNAERLAINDFGPTSNWEFSTENAYNSLFIKQYYAPYLKTADCKYNGNYNSRINTASGKFALSYIWADNAVCLPNGSILYASNYGSNGRIAGNTIYIDINGPQKPNIFGKDIFEMYVQNNSLTDPYYSTSCSNELSFCVIQTYSEGSQWNGDRDILINNCYDRGGNAGNNSCGYMIQEAGWQIPDDYPIRF